jgi:hypothetical protein
VASDGADAARQAIRSCALKYELAINLNTALGREVPMLLAKVIATFAPTRNALDKGAGALREQHRSA